jgi:preprotein translocase subunit SecF
MSDQVVPKGRFSRLYHGLTTIDFVGRKKLWFTISITVIVIGLASLGVRGFNLGIDFKGGESFEVFAPHSSVVDMTNAVTKAGLVNPTVEKLGTDTYEVSSDFNSLSASQQNTEINNVSDAMAKQANTTANQVSISTVGPTWGSQITNKALEALFVFFFAVVLYISIRFEPKMALAAFVAMVHDLLVTIGVYSLFGFQITPDTVIAILTILGYSLYDTVVVFDRVRDNSRGVFQLGDMTYSDMVNLSMNQTLARSINTSLVAILPVLSILVVGAYVLGATTLQYYGLALFVGLLSGAYSSIFIASPMLAWFKEREPKNRDLAAKVAKRGRQVLSPAAAAKNATVNGLAAGTASSNQNLSDAAMRGVIQARARKQKRR